MKQITEDYVSYKIAALLKDKGFKGKVHRWYTQYEEVAECTNIPHDYFDCPTFQMTLKWLREVHNIYIDILTYTTGKNIQFRWVGYGKGKLFSQEEGKTIYFDSYEQAVEAALLYVLKNLI